MKYTNRLRQTLLLCGLAVAPTCLAGGGDGTVSSCNDPNQPPPQVEVRFLYSTGDGEPQELKEGTQLHTRKDRYWVRFTPQRDYLITIFQKSGNDMVALTGANRLIIKAGLEYTVPGEGYRGDCDGTGKGYCLAGLPGEEALYFVACPYEGGKAESKLGTYSIDVNCSKAPCVKHVTFKHVD